MNPVLYLVPSLLIAGFLLYGLLRSVGRIWLDHKVRLTLLEKAEQQPELVASMNEFLNVVNTLPGASVRGGQDYRVTGILLAVIGLGCSAIGRGLHVGQIAVGLYVGGLICVGAGILLTLLGLLLRWLARPPMLTPPKR